MKIVNGTHYPDNTPQEVINAVEKARTEKLRIHIHLGDVVTGQDWHEENDVHGYISRTMGNGQPNAVKAPIIIASKGGSGGPAFSPDAIVKIDVPTTGVVLYQHPTYKAKVYKIKFTNEYKECPFATLVNGELDARHKNQRAARLYITKVGGIYGGEFN